MNAIRLILIFLIFSFEVHAQKPGIHSHNDYQRSFPFWEAYIAGCTSIEADVILKNDTLFVAHSIKEIKKDRTFEKLYIEPISLVFAQSNSFLGTNKKSLQLLVDIKTESISTLSKLTEIISQYRQYFDRTINPLANTIVISGNIPQPEEVRQFPSYFRYDLREAEEVSKYGENAGLISRNFSEFTVWNGLGRPVESELQKLRAFVDLCHKANSPVRFWNSPDTKTAYTLLYNLGVDFINTDKPTQTAAYLSALETSVYQNIQYTEPYQLAFPNGLDTSSIKNIILLIGDGMGFSQLMAGYIGNRGRLTCTNFRITGFMSTWSADNLCTDSAAGGTAIASGKKTRNRYIGMDTLYNTIPNIIEIASARGLRTGIVTSDKITGATPASFYAHQTERDKTEAIFTDLLESDIDFIAGYKPFNKNFSTGNFVIADNINKIEHTNDKPMMYFIEESNRDRYDSLTGSFLAALTQKSIEFLENEKGFFLMVECSDIDGGGHANNINVIVDAVIQLDKAVSISAKYADTHPGTLVIVTADHETGGLVIPGGNIQKAQVEGHFFSNDHTANWVPVMAYGAGATEFSGMYENTEVYHKIFHLMQK